MFHNILISKISLRTDSVSSSQLYGNFLMESSQADEQIILDSNLDVIQHTKDMGESLRIDAVVDQTSNFSSIMKGLKEIRHQNGMIWDDVKLIKSQLDNFAVMNKKSDTSMNWMKNNNISWPLSTKKEFENLNVLLKNEDIRSDFVKL
ncbi:uncharacterized protein [Prorops nasuta]|uniref:uncharacterized protein isoform X1 n=2 Tax=Prorops nasuta TaxID=863751 RepID=UPI0034CEDF0F